MHGTSWKTSWYEVWSLRGVGMTMVEGQRVPALTLLTVGTVDCRG